MNPVFTAAYVSKLTPLFYRIANEVIILCIFWSFERLPKLGSFMHGWQPRSNRDLWLWTFWMAWPERLSNSFLKEVWVTPSTPSTKIAKNLRNFMRHWKMFCKLAFSKLSLYPWTEQTFLISPAASRLFFLLPYLESWRKIQPAWLRRTLAKIAYSLPWQSLRYFMNAVNTMHPVCAKVFHEKREAMERGGIAALASTTSGGRDLTTLLSERLNGLYTDWNTLTIWIQISAG